MNTVTLNFCPDSPDYVRSISPNAGIIPNMPSKTNAGNAKRVGIFRDAMPQTVITEAYNYRLDRIVLTGSESQTYIDNLRRTLVPDILPEVEIVISN